MDVTSHSVNIICEESVRYSFVSHLAAALRRQDITVSVFTDSDPDEHNQSARVSVIVFSETYALSVPWFVKFLNRRRNNGLVTIPVFYGVTPWDVRFCDRQVIENSSYRIQNDSDYVEEIVRNVNREISCTKRIGIYSKLLEIENMLCEQPWEVRTLGIWGMPGIGKTTLAKAVFEHMCSDYDASCFIESFDEGLRKVGPHRLLQEKFGVGITRMNELRDTRVLVVLDDVRDSLAAVSFLGRLDWCGLGSLIIITSRYKQVFALCQVKSVYKVKGLNEDEAMQLFSQSAFGTDLPEEGDRELPMKVIKYADGNPLALRVYGQELEGNKSEMVAAFLELKECPPQKIYERLKSVYSSLGDNEKYIFVDIACFFKGENVDYVVELLEGCGYFPRVGIDVLVEKCLVTISENTLQMNELIRDVILGIISGERIQMERCATLWQPSSIRCLLELDELKADGEPKKTPNFVDGGGSSDSHRQDYIFNAKKRKMLPTWSVKVKISPERGLEDDVFSWRKYDQKDILGAKFPMSYYRCTHRSTQNCWATKLVQRSDGDTTVFEVTYRGTHTCLQAITPPLPPTLPEKQETRPTQKPKALLESLKTNLTVRTEGLHDGDDIFSFPHTPPFSDYGTINNSEFGHIDAVDWFNPNVEIDTALIWSVKSRINRLPLFLQAAEDIKGVSFDTSILMFDVNPDAFKDMVSLRFLKVYNSYCKIVSGLNFPKGLHSLPCELRLLYWENYPFESLPEGFDLRELVELNMPYSQLKKLRARTKNLEKLKKIRLCHSQQLVTFTIHGYAQNIELIDLQGCVRLESFPAMTKLQHLRVLNLSGCRSIKVVPGLPINIEELYLEGTSIEEIPVSTVSHSSQVNCKELMNHLKYFPDLEHIDLERVANLIKVSSCSQGFNKLVRLDMKDCYNLQSLPDMFSLESLQVLDLSSCYRLQQIKGFPRNMKELYLAKTAIRELPKLPESLEFLNAHNCEHLKSVCLDFEQLPKHYTFSNCFSLSLETTASFLEKILTRVIRLAGQQYQEYIEAPTFSICFPSGLYPSWRAVGSSVTVELAPYAQKDLSGFAMSVVVSFQDDTHNALGLGIRCTCLRETKKGQFDRKERVFKCWAPQKAPSIERDHLFVFYDAEMHPGDGERMDQNMPADKFIFEFHTVSGENVLLGASCVVRLCDVKVIM